MNALRVGIVGTGMMGAPMGRHLVEAGFSVTAYDVSAEALQQAADVGADTAGSPAALAEVSDVTLVIVRSDEEVRSVCADADGLFEGAARGSVLVICSSVLPATCEEIGRQAQSHGVEVLDAPLTGGPRRAEDATLTLLVGGAESSLAKARPVLDTVGSTLHHLGGLGSGQIGKTVNNVIHWGEVVVITEALALGAALGVNVSTLRPALIDASVDSRTLREIHLMKLTWPEKDLVNALSIADDVGQELDVAELVREKMRGINPDRVAKLLNDQGW